MPRVTVVVEPDDYARVLAEMAAQGGGTTLELRKALAAKAYARTAAYDAAIGGWFAGDAGRADARAGAAFAGSLAQELRYGENPHQRAAFYAIGRARARASPRPCSTRARSSPTTTSTTPTRPSSWSPSSTRRSRRPSPSSSTPTRAASAIGATLREAYAKALRCDPVSAFGGIIALNGPIDAATARGDHRHLHRGGDRARTPATRPRRSSPPRRTCAC